MAEGTYTVLARRFRPQGFADVVGQEHISQALRNAILSNRVAHAYLFTGARGVGKTSTARILAKALNCPDAKDGDPCNTCEICDGISTGSDVDVLEIDGASNRGIDDIRSLRANVNVKSMRTQYKIYIIDEVHMLTKEAFNALLKTLEEPPPNVKFVFCTTEPNKIPDTILSRCQRFDFGTIETTSIKGRLGQIAQAEGVQVDEAALELVARRATGSMRDSQSIFDQLLAFGEEHVTAADVHRLLGTASDERLIEIGAALVARDQATALSAFHSALEGGVQLGELTDQLLSYLRDLMILATGAARVELLSVAPVSRDALAAQAEQWGLQTIVAALQVLAETKGRMQRVTYGRALAELALVRIALLEDLTNVAGLIEKLRSGEAAPAAQKKSELISSTAAPANVSPQVEAGSARVPSAETVAEPAASSDAPLTRPSGTLSPEGRGEGLAVLGSGGDQAATDADVPSLEAETTVVSAAGSTSTATGRAELAFAPENADAIWTQVVSEINDMLKSHVKAVSRAAISAPNSLELSFPQRYHFAKRFCEQPDTLRRLEGIASRLTGQQVQISLVVSEESGASGQSDVEAAQSADRDGRLFKPEDDEFVSAVMQTFSAQCVRVDPVAPKLDGAESVSEETDD